MLPQVTLRVSETPENFLRQMEMILNEEDDLTVKAKHKLHGEHDYLSLGFSPERHEIEDLVGKFVYWPEDAPILRVEAIARWQTPFPRYDIYIDTIRDLFTERLKTYNQIYKRRYRLRIPSKKSTHHCLTPKLKEKFESFAALANKRCLHSYDWQRFYQFVVASYRTQPDLAESDVRYHLLKAGFDAEYSDYIANAFYRCKDFYIETDWHRRRRHYKK